MSALENLESKEELQAAVILLEKDCANACARIVELESYAGDLREKLFQAEAGEVYLASRVARLDGLVRCLIDNDPNQDAADGVTVYMVWLEDAKQALAQGTPEQAGSQEDE